jgi:hypothetical protein
MGLRQKLSRCLWIGTLPLMVGFTVSVAPAQAATMTLSRSTAYFTNFSHNPVFGRVEPFAEQDSVATDGEAGITGTAFGVFDNRRTSNQKTYAESTSEVKGGGNGRVYRAEANSTARITGFGFDVGAGETFSFSLRGLLELVGEISNFQYETAIAEGSIAFAVIDADTNETLDAFGVEGTLNVDKETDSDIYNIGKIGTNFFLEQSTAGLISSPGMPRPVEFITSGFWGGYSRRFDQDTRLTLIEIKQNYGLVKAPEASTIAGLAIVGASVIGSSVLRKRKASVVKA